jgi:hypothetical protein
MFILWGFRHLSEHLRRAREIEAALRSEFPYRRQSVECAEDVDIQGGERILETFRDKTLRSEVIEFIRPYD